MSRRHLVVVYLLLFNYNVAGATWLQISCSCFLSTMWAGATWLQISYYCFSTMWAGDITYFCLITMLAGATWLQTSCSCFWLPCELGSLGCRLVIIVSVPCELGSLGCRLVIVVSVPCEQIITYALSYGVALASGGAALSLVPHGGLWRFLLHLCWANTLVCL